MRVGRPHNQRPSVSRDRPATIEAFVRSVVTALQRDGREAEARAFASAVQPLITQVNAEIVHIASRYVDVR